MADKVTLSPPPTVTETGIGFAMMKWFSSLYERIGGGPFLIKGYSKADLPSVSEWGNNGTTQPFSSLIYVRDATGGAALAYSTGVNWISTRTGNPV